MTESGCARRLRGLCLHPRRPGHWADEQRVLAGWPGGGMGTGGSFWEPGLPAGLGRVSQHLLTCPSSRKSPDSTWGSRWRCRGTDVHRQVWWLHELVRACRNARGRVGPTWESVAGRGSTRVLGSEHLGPKNSGLGSAGARLGQTRCGHVCGSVNCARVGLSTHVGIDEMWAYMGGCWERHILTLHPPGPAQSRSPLQSKKPWWVPVVRRGS